jgi:hypothetical protein
MILVMIMRIIFKEMLLLLIIVTMFIESGRLVESSVVEWSDRAALNE